MDVRLVSGVQTPVPLACHKYIHWYRFTSLPNTHFAACAPSSSSSGALRIPSPLPATLQSSLMEWEVLLCVSWFSLAVSRSQCEFLMKIYLYGWLVGFIFLRLAKILFPIFTWAYYCLSECFLISSCRCFFSFFQINSSLFLHLLMEEHFSMLYTRFFFGSLYCCHTCLAHTFIHSRVILINS